MTDLNGNDTAMSEDQVLQKEIEYFLSQMYSSTAQLKSYQILQGGISGAATYWLHTVGEELVCKFTRAGSKPGILERALRELRFYQSLAPLLSLRVPQVLAHVQNTQGIALLLKACRPSPPASSWQPEDYFEVASQLGQFHATFWNSTEQVGAYSWLRKDSEQNVQQAIIQWQVLSEIPGFASHIPIHRFQQVMHLLSQLPLVENSINDFPVTICHGDCHSGNVLQDEHDNLIWADWQEVGIGLGPAYLSFFIQRAFFAGAAVPDEDMVVAYYQQLTNLIKDHFSLASLRQLMDVVEVRAWLLSWPPYLQQGSPTHLVKVLDRIDYLAHRLHLDK